MNERQVGSGIRPNLGRVIGSAIRKNWDLMNAALTDPSDPSFSAWLIDGLGSSDLQVRGLAAETSENMASVPSEEVRVKLHMVMVDRHGDTASRYYAASALYKHGMPSPEVLEVIEGAARQTRDPDLAKVAKARLAEIEEMERQAHEQNSGT